MYSVKKIYSHKTDIENLIVKASKDSGIFFMNIFTENNLTDYFNVKNGIEKKINEVFANIAPAWSLINQKPLENDVCIEYYTSDRQKNYRQAGNVNIVEMDNEIWVGNLSVEESRYSAFFEDNVRVCFDKMVDVLNVSGYVMNDVQRQWNYIGNIIGVDAENNQNYQIFNEIRSVYYHKYKTNNYYPSATGIGQNLNICTIAFMAKKSVEYKDTFALHSSVQENAFNYEQKILIGQSVNKSAPLFERGRKINYNNGSLIFVSGTASIRNQETINSDDIEMQTKNTLTFIDELLKNNFNEEIIKNMETINMRVYVKRKQDMRLVENICRKKMENLLVLNAEICRDNLLVEIEKELRTKN